MKMRLARVLFSVALCISFAVSHTWVLTTAGYSVTPGQSATLNCEVGVKDAAVSQTPVLTPAGHSVTLGQSATLNCEVGVKDGGWIAFIKQTPGQVPMLIMGHHHTLSKPTYGPGVSYAHFTATINSAGTLYQFTIQGTEIADTAHYYCVKWYDSLSGYVFSQSSKLIVTGAPYPEPSIVLFPPQPREATGNVQPTLACHISNLSVGFGTVNWKEDGKVIQSAVTSEPAKGPGDTTFSMSSYLTLANVNLQKEYTCQIQQAGSDAVTAQSLKLSECA